MYLLVMIQQWLNLVLNMTVAVLAIIVITLATQLRTTSSGFTGAGLVSLMSFGQMLTSLVHTYTLLETATGALSRLKSFSETVKSENLDDETVIPAVEWPSKGAIEIKGVSAVYEYVPMNRLGPTFVYQHLLFLRSLLFPCDASAAPTAARAAAAEALLYLRLTIKWQEIPSHCLAGS
jgi:hypothetical protein